MKLDTFISEALINIEKGMNTATNTTKKSYRIIDERDALGLEFDIAVTTVNSEVVGAQGEAKAGIEVMGISLASAKGMISSDRTEGKSEVSRLKFSIHVKEYTDEQEKQHAEEYHKKATQLKSKWSGI